MFRLLMVCAGGFVGTGTRYVLNGWVSRRFGETFPLGTLTVNVAGSFAIGFVYIATGPDSRLIVGATMRQLLVSGLLGGFTTFSSFSIQTLTLARGGELFASFLNVVLSVGLGLGAAWLGEIVARNAWPGA